jgi:Right handed beta helix region
VVNTAVTLQADGSVLIPAGRDIQQVIAGYPAGTTFRIGAGIHRRQSVIPRNGDRFIGEPGAILSGAVVVDGFTQDGSRWVLAGRTEQEVAHGSCQSDRPGCRYTTDLFLNGAPLRQVLSLDALAPGNWYFDYAADRVYMADDPAGQLVELSGNSWEAFSGSASNVTIANLTIERYANPAQHGAIHGGTGSNWLVRDNLVRFNHGLGVRTGDGMQLLNNTVVSNGQLGVGGAGLNVLVQGNEIAWNNTLGFNAGWEAGGTKFAKTQGLVVRENYVHNNNGPGLWTDIDNDDVLYEDNLVEWNGGAGISHEISYSAVIRNNTVRYNGINWSPWLWGAQIMIQNSAGAEVYGNEVTVSADGGSGIVIIAQNRAHWVSADNYIHDNRIIYLGNSGFSGMADDTATKPACDAEANNRFDGNDYEVPDPTRNRWHWCNRYDNWEQLQDAGQELNGTVAITE